MVRTQGTVYGVQYRACVLDCFTAAQAHVILLCNPENNEKQGDYSCVWLIVKQLSSSKRDVYVVAFRLNYLRQSDGWEISQTRRRIVTYVSSERL